MTKADNLRLDSLYDILFERLIPEISPSEWWPDGKGLDWLAKKEATFEGIVGAVLIQNTTWHNNASRAVENLRLLEVLEPKKLLGMGNSALRKAIRPVGFTDRKVDALRGVSVLMTRINPNEMDTNNLKKVLLRIRGIGEETSDVILLYAFNRLVMPVSIPARRIIERIFGFKAKDYKDFQVFLVDNLRKDVEVYKTFNALLLEFGLRFCQKTRARCDGCKALGEKSPYLTFNCPQVGQGLKNEKLTYT